MTWEEYCISKKIDSDVFKVSEPVLWIDLKNNFEQLHPVSFTEQKKFLINEWRRSYPLKSDTAQKGS